MKLIRPVLLAGFALASVPAAVHAQAAPADSAARNWHLLDPAADRVPGISAERAHRELLARRPVRDTIIVAIIDSGVEVDHPDLDGVLWTNRREVPGNGRDDDRNGYVDDVHGWNFIGGRDGRNVKEDTYEVTRLYAQLRPRFQNADSASVPAADRADYTLWRRVKADFESRRAEEEQTLGAIKQAEETLRQAETILKREMGTTTLTPSAVTLFSPKDQMGQQARQIYLHFAGLGYSLERVVEARESTEAGVRFSLNPEFDPRNIVGDDARNPNERGYGNNQYEGPDAGHGTHVAGIVAAERGNGQGIDGIAPAVRIMSLRAVPQGDERDKDVANAIRYAVDNGARVVNMSFGKSFSPQKELVDAAVRYAEEKGVLLVHAAGNDGADISEDPSFPTPLLQGGRRAANWIEVGAASWQGGDHLAAPFSNYDERLVDVFAPGMAILSTVPDGEIQRNDGTSMAAPVVAGVAATILSYYPQLTAAQVRQVIMESATRFEGLSVVRPGSEDERVPFAQLSGSGGVVNLHAALQLAERMSRR
ncbi:S8 family peptidase [Longimicrobium sp.]|uniref:S8 family peptidase n=1 Tax=Longimicrobium sp. TaxID=2029185 RepID=UPI002F95CE43